VSKARLRLPRVDTLRVPTLSRRTPFLHHSRDERPQVVAHRGYSSDWAEHTLAAYVEALKAGAEALECDVRLTADGHLVCVHDRRINRTSNGQGVVSTLPLEQLQGFDFASWKSPWRELDDEADDLDPSHRGILTLEALLDTVRDWHRPVEIAIETKHPTRYAGLVERRLVELLHRYGWARPKRGQPAPVRVMSFSWMSLRRVLEFAPSSRTVYLMERVPMRYRDGSLPLGAGIAGPSIEIVRAHPEYVERVHSQGHEVHVWTVNDQADVDLCARVGVDAIITDKPAATLARLQNSLN
jgi:glycerophosphoryl diester phosphodiesterase